MHNLIKNCSLSCCAAVEWAVAKINSKKNLHTAQWRCGFHDKRAGGDNGCGRFPEYIELPRPTRQRIISYQCEYDYNYKAHL
jgi:hypothetical protein